MSTSIARQIRNIRETGLKRYWKQLNTLGEAKGAGVLVGVDDFGNEFYETKHGDEIHLRTRWVEYKTTKFWDMSHLEPGWHYWLGYGTDIPPNKLEGAEKTVRGYELPRVHSINYTGTTGAYVPYNTTRPKFQSWTPVVKQRTD